MFFNKRPKFETPMDHFLNREVLNEDERSVLDVYLTGVSHTLVELNTVHINNDRDPIFKPSAAQDLTTIELETILDEFLKQRPDMQTKSLGLCAVMAVLQRYPA